ncbi:MAG: LacI family DNA-binding transcriptional regulator [Chloroflexota bacterium]
MANISDVARLVEVSERTVSRVLNEDPRVSARTRQAVLRAMQELSYVPNQAARSLRGAHTRTIGVVIFDLNNLALLQAVPAMEEVVREHGYSLFLCDSQGSADVESANLRRLNEQRVEGLVLFMVGGCCPDLNLWSTSNVPVLALPANDNHAVPTWATTMPLRVPVGLREALQYLVTLGHRRVAIVRSDMPSMASPAYDMRALIEGLPLDSDPSLELVLRSGPEGVQAAADLLRRPDRPTAMLSILHAFSPYLLQGIHMAGLTIPRDFSFIAMGDSPWAAAYWPPITAVRFEFATMGRRLAEYIFARLDGAPTEGLLEEIRDLFVPRLVVRDSCTPPAASR